MTPKSLMGFIPSCWEILRNIDKWETPCQEEQNLMVMKVELKAKEVRLRYMIHPDEEACRENVQ
jgi:hypothetical protein